jgi:hypothetical protein
MAEVTIEIDEQGNIGKLPEPLQKFFDKGFNEAFKKGAAKVESELKDKTLDPVERERLKLVEQENAKFREDKALAEKNYEEARRLQEERLSKIATEKDEHISAREAEIAKRDTRLRSMLGSEIRAAAVAAGARDESLPELVKLLGADLDLDADLEAYVKGEDGKPRTDKAGNPISIEGFVTQYLADHPHHLRSTRSKPGNSRGGATYGGGGTTTAAQTAIEALHEKPTVTNVARTLRAQREARGQ